MQQLIIADYVRQQTDRKVEPLYPSVIVATLDDGSVCSHCSICPA